MVGTPEDPTADFGHRNFAYQIDGQALAVSRGQFRLSAPSSSRSPVPVADDVVGSMGHDIQIMVDDVTHHPAKAYKVVLLPPVQSVQLFGG